MSFVDSKNTHGRQKKPTMARVHRRQPREADSLLDEIKKRHRHDEEKKQIRNQLANAVDPTEKEQLTLKLNQLQNPGGVAGGASVAGQGRGSQDQSWWAGGAEYDDKESTNLWIERLPQVRGFSPEEQ